MFIALDDNECRIPASKARRREPKARRKELYHCPRCQEDVILKQGPIVIDHYAHYPGSQCTEWEPESQLHLEMKLTISENLKSQPEIKNVYLEKSIGKLYADIFVELISGEQIGIECQVSPKSITEFTDKTNYYSERDVYTLWIFEFVKKELSGTYYTPSKTMLKSHSLNAGRLYGYFGPNQIRSIHFENIGGLRARKNYLMGPFVNNLKPSYYYNTKICVFDDNMSWFKQRWPDCPYSIKNIRKAEKCPNEECPDIYRDICKIMHLGSVGSLTYWPIENHEPDKIPQPMTSKAPFLTPRTPRSITSKPKPRIITSKSLKFLNKRDNRLVKFFNIIDTHLKNGKRGNALMILDTYSMANSDEISDIFRLLYEDDDAGITRIDRIIHRRIFDFRVISPEFFIGVAHKIDKLNLDTIRYKEQDALKIEGE